MSNNEDEKKREPASDIRPPEKAGQSGIKWYQKIGRTGYIGCYIIGAQTVRSVRFAGKRLGRLLAPLGRSFYKAADRLLLRHMRVLGGEFKRFGRGFPEAGRRLRAAWKRHPLLVIPQALLLPWQAFKRHRRAALSLVNLLMPVAAAFVLVATIQYWSGQTFGLALEYDGRSLGYIVDESVYDKAANLAMARVNNTDNSFQVERTPKLTIAMVNGEDILDENTLCDEILRSSSDSIAEGSGLYIDGEFEGAMESRAALDALLDGILKTYSSGSADERAEFIQKVEVIDGLYPISSMVLPEEMSGHLTAESVVAKHYTVQAGETLGTVARKNDMTLAELRALNAAYQSTDMVHAGDSLLIQRSQPYLRVQVVRTLKYSEDIAFQTQKIQDNNQPTTYSKVKTKGVKGSKDIVAEVLLLDGVEQSRKVISETVTKEPVTQVEIVGTKKVVSSAGTTVKVGDGISTGQFLWPVPICNRTSRGFAGGHGALDICNGPVTVRNKPFIAADGGVVEKAGWGGGYGNMVIIRHDNGYKTLYAHANKLYVVTGQKVTKGQELGLIGSTGNSTGPHLHFEVRRNNVRIDPMQFFR